MSSHHQIRMSRQRTGHKCKAGHPESSSPFFHFLPFSFLSARKSRCQKCSFLKAFMSYREKVSEFQHRAPQALHIRLGRCQKSPVGLKNFLPFLPFPPSGCRGPRGTHTQGFHRLPGNLSAFVPCQALELPRCFAVSEEEQGGVWRGTGLCM